MTETSTNPRVAAVAEIISRADGLAILEPSDVVADLEELVDDLAEDREHVAHILWSLGAKLDHKKCRAGDDADYVNRCTPCETYLRAVADTIITALAADIAPTITSPAAEMDEGQVDVVAAAIYEVRDNPYDETPWEEADYETRERYECNARAAITALTRPTTTALAEGADR